MISVVIPTFNRSATIKAALQSVCEQTYSDLEIIVVDDGSTDDTEAIVRALKLPNLTYIRHTKNRGACAARNTGIEAARGSYIAFQDSDDSWHAEKLEMQLKACLEFDVGVSFCAFTRHTGGKQVTIPKPGYGVLPGCHHLHAKLLRASFISCQTLLIKKDLLLQTGLFDVDLPRLQDWELCLRLAKNREFVFLEQPLVDVELQDDSISHGSDNYARAADLIVEKHLEDFSQDKMAAAILYANVAITALRSGQLLKGLKYLGKAMYFGRTTFPASLLVLAQRR